MIASETGANRRSAQLERVSIVCGDGAGGRCVGGAGRPGRLPPPPLPGRWAATLFSLVMNVKIIVTRCGSRVGGRLSGLGTDWGRSKTADPAGATGPQAEPPGAVRARRACSGTCRNRRAAPMVRRSETLATSHVETLTECLSQI